MARTLSARVQQANAEDSVQPLAADSNASLISSAAYESSAYASPGPEEFESSARLITPPAPLVPKRPIGRPAPELVAMPARPPVALSPEPTAPVEEAPRYSSRNWRAEAWDRERERELRAVERRPDTSPRRRAGS